MKGHPLADWMAGEIGSFERTLLETHFIIPFTKPGTFKFSRQRIIDVFLNTQYAHQPNTGNEKFPDRELQFRECLAAVSGKKAVLTWLFLCSILDCASKICCAGKIIVNFFELYIKQGGETCNFLDSVGRENPGIGKLETAEAKEKRLFAEQVTCLAQKLWEQAGSPDGGPTMFAKQAEQGLYDAFHGRIHE
jgi:hypothetical protein